MRSQKRAGLLGFLAGLGVLTALPGWAVTSHQATRSPTDIFVEQLHGDVDVTMSGVAREVVIDSLIDVPSRIITGDDGSIGIRQGGTGVSVAPSSDVEILEAARNGQLIAHMFQHSGSVFYDVETRPVEKLHVETPHLVAVVKGTQFTIAVTDTATTVSLFEGLLEIRSPDDTQIIELNAGEIAIRSLAGGEINRLPMDADLLGETAQADGLNPAAGPVAAVDTAVDTRLPGVAAAVQVAGNQSDVALVADDGVALALNDTGARVDMNLAAIQSPDFSGGIEFDVGGDLEAATVDIGLDTGVDLGGGAVDVGLDADVGVGADLGGAGVDLGADLGLDTGVDLGGGAVDVGLDADVGVGADLGGAGVDLGADLGLDTGVDLGGGAVDVGLDADVGVGADLGGAGVDLGADLGLDTGVDLGGGAVDVGLDADVGVGADLGGAGVDLGADLGLDTGVDLGGGAVDVGFDADVGVGADLGGGAIDVGLDADVDLGEDLGVDLDTDLDVDLDLGLDLGLGPDTDDDSGGGGLLGPLL